MNTHTGTLLAEHNGGGRGACLAPDPAARFASLLAAAGVERASGSYLDYERGKRALLGAIEAGLEPSDFYPLGIRLLTKYVGV